MGLTDEAEISRLELAGAQAPEVDRELARDRHDRFLSGRASGKGAFGQDLAPFYDRFVGGLEADQTPGSLDQRGSQARVAMFGHAALHPSVATGVFSGAEAGVAGGLPPVLKPVPVAHLAVGSPRY